MSTTELTSRVQVLGAPGERFDEILTPAALDFLGCLAHDLRRPVPRRPHRAAPPRPSALVRFAARLLAGHLRHPCRSGLAGRPARAGSRRPPGGDHRAAGAADDIDALNSGAQVWLADFEDATSPTWDNIIGGQLNLLDAIERRIDFTAPDGTEYRLGDQLATIVVRPRGWHLTEEHLLVDGRPVPASLVDFGLYFFHCAQRQIDAGSGPYFYLPKLENAYDARLWNDVFVLAQDLLGIPRGTIRATVLIETVTAAFEMEEILYELREHSAGLNAGRWDYLFSLIKTFAHRPDFSLPDRTKVTMTAPFLRAYTELLVRTCHKRGAHAIGGMAAHVPGHDTPADGAALGQGAARQGARSRGRLRRDVGRPPRARPLLPRHLRRRTGRAPAPDRPHPRRRGGLGRRTAGRPAHRGTAHRGRRARQHRASRCATSTPGCAAPVPWRWRG